MKKILALVLAMMMIIAMFAGCAQEAKTDDTAKTDSSASTEKKEETKKEETKTEDKKEEEKKEEAPAVDEKPTGTLSIYRNGLGMHADYTSEDQSPYHVWIEEATGVDIEWLSAPVGADGNQAFNLMLSSGDLPDVIYAGGWPSQVELLIEDGVIRPLDDVFEEKAPNLSAYLEEHPDTKKAVTSDSGHLYVFPFLREDVAFLGSYLGAAIHTGFLAETGLDKPVTLADWEEMLYAMKDVVDIPISIYDKGMYRNLFANAFGFKGDATYAVIDGKASTWYNAEGYYDFLVTMNKWYEDGIIDPDFATMDMTGFVNQMTTKTIGATYYGTGTPARFSDLLIERDCAFLYEAVEYPVANAGDPVLYCQGETFWGGTGFVITTACEDIDLAMYFCDYGYSEEGILQWNYGKLGESYEMVNGEPKVLESILTAEEGATSALKRYTPMTGNGPSIMLVSWNMQKNLPLANDYIGIWTNNTDKASSYRWPAVCATAEESLELSEMETALNTYAGEMYLNFILGAESLDNYDEYLSNLEQLKINEILAIKDAQLQRYLAR